jgi:Tim10/DDP family zinc finger
MYGAKADDAQGLRDLAKKFNQDIEIEKASNIFHSAVQDTTTRMHTACMKRCLADYSTRELTNGESECLTNCFDYYLRSQSIYYREALKAINEASKKIVPENSKPPS